MKYQNYITYLNKKIFKVNTRYSQVTVHLNKSKIYLHLQEMIHYESHVTYFPSNVRLD